jgi:hypothetical protein
MALLRAAVSKDGPHALNPLPSFETLGVKCAELLRMT